ncbi:hypothetical protein [Streptomyces sp. NPDC002067]
MTPTFGCDDGSTEGTVRPDPDGYVELVLRDVGVGREPKVLHLEPEDARRFARAVTLASFDAEGVDVSDALRTAIGPGAGACPKGDGPCGARHPDRLAWRGKEGEDTTPPHRPAEGPAGPRDRFLAARKLAGPAAHLDDVLKLAAYLTAAVRQGPREK